MFKNAILLYGEWGTYYDQLLRSDMATINNLIYDGEKYIIKLLLYFILAIDLSLILINNGWFLSLFTLSSLLFG